MRYDIGMEAEQGIYSYSTTLALELELTANQSYDFVLYTRTTRGDVALVLQKSKNS